MGSLQEDVGTAQGDVGTAQGDVGSPQGDVGVSPNFGIRHTTPKIEKRMINISYMNWNDMTW